MAVKQTNEDKRQFDLIAWVTGIHITGIQSALYLLAGIYIGAMLFDGGGVEATESGYAVNLWTELIGIAVTVVIINAISQRRADADRKQLLFAQLKSKEAVIALLAFEELKLRGWIAEIDKNAWYGLQLPKADMSCFDLSGADLGRADLSGVGLWEADLSGAMLATADLSGADLGRADLSGAILLNADLSGATLSRANLSDANLVDVDLSGAYLVNADLSGTDLEGANLRDVRNLDSASFDANTTLPDGSTWSPDIDLTRFTSGMWQPEYDETRFSHYQIWKRNGWLTPPDDEA